jgi:hypothetical protein
MKLQLKKIVEVLSKMKDDDFYFKSYDPEIIESYVNQENIASNGSRLYLVADFENENLNYSQN